MYLLYLYYVCIHDTVFSCKLNLAVLNEASGLLILIVLATKQWFF